MKYLPVRRTDWRWFGVWVIRSDEAASGFPRPNAAPGRRTLSLKSSILRKASGDYRGYHLAARRVAATTSLLDKPLWFDELHVGIPRSIAVPSS